MGETQENQVRSIVICLDGTSNEPQSGITNVGRLFGMLVNDDAQLTYYDPGVGTMPAPGAWTRAGRFLTRVAGLVIGRGVRENVAEAYTYLMRTYQPGDRIYVFGYSRGAYTARALTGLLHTVGLLRPGAENLVPYALKLFTSTPPHRASEQQREKFWGDVRRFTAAFSRTDFPSTFGRQVRYAGLWDTVKSVGAFNVKARFEQVRWPYTSRITNVETARHALAADERRRPFAEHRLNWDLVDQDTEGRFVELWFRGTHGDVGGCHEQDHRLSDIALSWVTQEAAANGLRIDADEFRKTLGFELGDPIPAALAEGAVHPNPWWWVLALGWRTRRQREGDAFHPVFEG